MTLEHDIGSVKLALSSDERAVLGFEELADWRIVAGSGTLAASSVASEGARSLAVDGSGYVAVENVTPLASDGTPAPALVGYDVLIPQSQRAPAWPGDTQLLISAPSAGIYNQYLGRHSFEGVPAGHFARFEYALPAWIRQALDRTHYTDLRFTIATNVDFVVDVLYVDNFHLGPLEGEFVEGTPGPDQIDLSGRGPSVVYALGADDQVTGGNADDHLEGSSGDDSLIGLGGADEIVGQEGNDRLFGGTGGDRLLPGAGRDESYGEAGDDYVVVMSSCQLQAGEVLDGGDGFDTLIAPVAQPALEALGVQVRGFERVIVTGEGAFGCDAACNCDDTFPLTPEDVCDFSSLASEPGVDVNALQTACNTFRAATPALVEALLANPTDEAADALLRQDPSLQAFQQQLVGVVTHDDSGAAFVPPTPPSTPLRDIDLRLNACDRPPRVVTTGVGGSGVGNCSAGEATQLRTATQYAAFLVWRMEQQVGAVLDAFNAGNTQQARALWQRGDDQFGLDWWFGDFDRARVEAVAETVQILRDRVHGDGGDQFGTFNVQCWHPLSAGRIVLFALFHQARLFAHYATPCFGTAHTHAHSFYAQPGAGQHISFLLRYPFASVQACPVLFEPRSHSPEELLIFQAGVLLHESLHWHRNEIGWLRDQHEASDDLCGGTCYGETDARLLAEQLPDVAVRNIDNYEAWADRVGAEYLLGYCDQDVDPLCIPSDCCGNGVRDPHETCDGQLPGFLHCGTVGAGLGELSCANDCQNYDTSQCLTPDDGTPVSELIVCEELSVPVPCTSDAQCAGLADPDRQLAEYMCRPSASPVGPLTCRCPPPVQ